MGIRNFFVFAVVACIGCADSFEPGTGTDGGNNGHGDGNAFCQIGEGKCEGQQTFLCSDDQTRWEAGPVCEWPTSCDQGYCTDPCSLAKAARSYVGCEYFAVDLDNAPSATGYSPAQAQFAIVVSYAGKTEHAVHVKVFAMVNGQEQVVSEGEVFPGGIKVFEVGPQNVAGTVQGMHAFRVSAAAPVTVYQFNPLNNTLEAYSNDASLLLPTSGLDTDYIAVTGDAVIISDTGDQTKTYDMGAFVTVVGVEDNTQVTITPSAPIKAGAGIPGGTAPVTRTLKRYEVLSLSSEVPPVGQPPGGNLSGTRVHADKPVAVFAGNAATLVPLGPDQKCCADHLEQQMIPLSAWGKAFVAARSRPRKKTAQVEPDYWRITGGADGITLTYAPAKPSGAPDGLNTGQSVQFSSDKSFTVQASGPILLTQFLASANHTGDMQLFSPCSQDNQCANQPFVAVCYQNYCGPVGDPAMILFPPVEQFRDEYVFLVPDDYFLDYATFIHPMDAVITLDDKPVGDQATQGGMIGGVPYGVTHVVLTDGKHRVSATKPVGVLAYGLDAYVSYGYPAGLNLERINIE